MYEAFYGFSEKPFSLLPDPTFLYHSKKHKLALALLEYGLLNQAGFSVITGEIGTGKTTLLRQLLQQIESDTTVGMITNTHQSFGDLLQWVLMAFNLDYKGKTKAESYQTFVEFIIQEYGANRRTVLIVDEAQNLPAETLEELRMLSNVNADKDQVLQVILVGQAELRTTLQRPDLIQFAQRITVDYHLDHLERLETREYIRHRINVASGKPGLFDDRACDLVHHYSGGVPRLINVLCDTALVYGFAEQLQSIPAKIVGEVALEKQKGGIFPKMDTAPPVLYEDAITTSEESQAERSSATTQVATEDTAATSTASSSNTKKAEPSKSNHNKIPKSAKKAQTTKQPAETSHNKKKHTKKDVTKHTTQTDAESKPLKATQEQTSREIDSNQHTSKPAFSLVKPANVEKVNTATTKKSIEEKSKTIATTNEKVTEEKATTEVAATTETTNDTTITTSEAKQKPAESTANTSVNIAVIANSESHRKYLETLVTNSQMDICYSLPFSKTLSHQIDPSKIDVMLIDLDESIEEQYDLLEEMLEQWGVPVLFNDSTTTSANITDNSSPFSKKLALKIKSIVPSNKKSPNQSKAI